FTYRNFYNGGGVASGDLTGNGLPDLYFTSNQESNRLYLNLGDYRFRDVTDISGVGGNGSWATGVTFVDIDGNGLLDLYVCYAGDVEGRHRANELYVNLGTDDNGVPRFREAAAEYGVADEGYSTHAVFLDYDRDGLLDLYVVNNSFRPVSSFGLNNIRHERHDLGGDKLYRNTGSGFVDVSKEAGIFGSEIGFGLGVVAGDINGDGLPDLYVSNDFFERDYLYLNNGDGTFREVLDEQFPYISHFSMGLDLADVNNDGLLDLYVTDMMPADDYRLKTTASFESWDTFEARRANDYHYQYMRNMLHLNNGDGTFSDVGYLAGVARTDWSWSALLADFDLDGHKDIYVTNGIRHDLIDQDYISYLANDETRASVVRGENVDYLRLVHAMSSTPIVNHAFQNAAGGLGFRDVSDEWGLAYPSFSSGAAYVDLNNDGALDLVVNNIDEGVFVFRNNARALSSNRYLQIALEGDDMNRFGIGARVILQAGDQLLHQEQQPARGFQSSVDYVLTFGLGEVDTVESVTVRWPDGRVSRLENLSADQRIVIRQADAQQERWLREEPLSSSPLFVEVTDEIVLDFVHRENTFVDFDRDRLIPKMLSIEGPAVAVADVTGDGLDDLYIGGAKDQAGRLFVQEANGAFRSLNDDLFEADAVSEDVGALFVDVNADDRLDLYVVSGGNEFSDSSPALQDRLYLNEGGGVFHTAGSDVLPRSTLSGSRAAAGGLTSSTDLRIVVGGRVVPWKYGHAPRSMLLQQNGNGTFDDVAAHLAPALTTTGMITDAVWADVDGDGIEDLVVVGEWMPITVFRGEIDGSLRPVEIPALQNSHGWWNRIVAADLTGNGLTDFVIGNLGLNTRLQAAPDKPVSMHVGEFGGKGVVSQIVSYFNGDISYPMKTRNDLTRTLSYLRPQFPNNVDYAGKTVDDIFPAEELDDALLRVAHTFHTSVLLNRGNGLLDLVPLPRQAQLAPVYAIMVDDFDDDGHRDILLAGNFDGFLPDIGRAAAGYGLFLKGDGQGAFEAISPRESGFSIRGQVRALASLQTPAGRLIMAARNNDRPVFFRVTSEPLSIASN
ncbi:MAG: VCBS repeat-containing protein, partial [Rhodothermales bacterium]